MDRDQFIITVYCLVCEHYAALRARVRLRHGGFAPALTDEEVITIEICGEYFKCGTDKDIFAYFVAHYQAFFPRLHDRSLFVRQAANLWLVTATIQQRLTVVSGQAEDGHVCEGRPVAAAQDAQSLEGAIQPAQLCP